MQWRSFGEGEHDLGEYLLSNQPVSVCDAFCFESFWAPGADSKLLWCALAPLQMDQVSFQMCFVYVLGIYVDLKSFSVTRVQVNTAQEDIQAQPPHCLG